MTQIMIDSISAGVQIFLLLAIMGEMGLIPLSSDDMKDTLREHWLILALLVETLLFAAELYDGSWRRLYIVVPTTLLLVIGWIVAWKKR